MKNIFIALSLTMFVGTVSFASTTDSKEVKTALTEKNKKKEKKKKKKKSKKGGCSEAKAGENGAGCCSKKAD